MKTETEIREAIEGLRNLTTAQLKQKYREVFGEESRSNHKSSSCSAMIAGDSPARLGTLFALPLAGSEQAWSPRSKARPRRMSQGGL